MADTDTVTVNAMTVDVEDYFQVQAFAGVIDRATWDDLPLRVEANTTRILDQFDRAGVKATFFTLGWVAERCPALIRRIVAAGHELASHGYGHTLVSSLTGNEFVADLHRSKFLLEDIGGVPIRGYRAPTFSIGPRTPWAYNALVNEGFSYSSSIFPIRHDLYGEPDAPRFAFRPTGHDIWELPMTTVRLGGRNLPCSGGGYFRLMPYSLFRMGLRSLNRSEHRSGIFYFHPWEVDPAQPRITAASRSARFRHYVNIAAMSGRLDRLLQDFRWDRIDRVFPDVVGATAARVAA